MCPSRALEISFNEHRQYVARLSGKCSGCGFCTKVCPFYGAQPNEDSVGGACFSAIPGVQHLPEVGYYVGSYVGYLSSEERRLSRSSGGLASWYLSRVLAAGLADRVICVIPDAGPGRFYRYAILETPEAVFNAARSCYYPVEMSEVLRIVRDRPGKYALIGLPCFLKGLRKAMGLDRALARRITAVVGLVCGQTKGGFFGEYLARLAGAGDGVLKAVVFRAKDINVPAHELLFTCRYDGGGGERAGRIRWSQGYGDAWRRGYFKVNACNFCDDIFGEVADVVFMDAWLPPYNRDPRGTSLVLARSREAWELLEAGRRSAEVNLEPLAIEKLVSSQQGVIDDKRRGLAVRLAVAAADGLIVPPKRVALASRVGLLDAWLARHAMQLSRRSQAAFLEQTQAGAGLDVFAERMRSLVRSYEFVRRVSRLWTRLLRAPAKVLRLVRV
ncbi:MAG: Coenzyme F420 hydrogenase/dehydrogenase, beta subunit C-terminal domain [Spirochaetes bacterium]|nr:Coenzyme F420 hydrogenase/dehydrogenase, beta subunit C-terminal domain [Spirochaetota bacterium]